MADWALPNRGGNSGLNIFECLLSYLVCIKLRPCTGVAIPRDLEKGVKLAELVFAAILMNMLSSQASAGATCESLASLSVGDTAITVAQTVAAGVRIA
jgi:hypothetical protein